MKGFKVVSENHIHHGLKYQKGLNIDPNPFRPEDSCVAYGLYFFTAIKDVVNWLSYGVYLYEVEIPEQHQYLEDDGKYRASALVLSNPLDLRKIDTWEYLIQQGVDTEKYRLSILYWATTNQYLKIVSMFLTKKRIGIL